MSFCSSVLMSIVGVTCDTWWSHVYWRGFLFWLIKQIRFGLNLFEVCHDAQSLVYMSLYYTNLLQMSKREYVKIFCDTFLVLKTTKLFSLGSTLKIKHKEKMWTLNMSSHAVCAFTRRPLDDLPLRLRFIIIIFTLGDTTPVGLCIFFEICSPQTWTKLNWCCTDSVSTCFS